MSDLISRSELIENLMKCEQLGRKSFWIIVNAINEQPTAYDIDKAVSELKTDSSVKLYGSQNSDNYMIPVKRAIKIVKQGGVSDDVCEYENTDDEYCKWKINSVFPETINNPHIAERENIATTKYCPCCGKKIKVVE